MRTISREEEMKEMFRFRISAKDKADIRKAAQKLGLNSSAYLRMLLIQQGIITP